jgi:predicted metalloprotease with PDZ domain
MPLDGRVNYLVILLPLEEDAGESFRCSVAMTSGATPSRTNVAAWGNMLAHEVFHYWNGRRLRGANY